MFLSTDAVSIVVTINVFIWVYKSNLYRTYYGESLQLETGIFTDPWDGKYLLHLRIYGDK